MDTTRKLAISLPRGLAQEVDQAATRRGVPRSQVVAAALRSYLDTDGRLTEDEEVVSINAALAEYERDRTPAEIAEDEAMDAFTQKAQHDAWRDASWTN
ncbi:MAG: CopG family ribbon-helix-helix protein [Candidatus Dormibacteraceae bacterium]